MGKRSKRRPVKYEKDQSGCMWGLISILHIRHGRFSRKLLPDKKHGSKHAVGAGYLKNRFEILNNCDEDCRGTHDDEESMPATANAGKPCVKKLIEQEMVNEQNSKKDIISNGGVEQKQSENEHIKKNLKSANKISRKSGNVSTNDSNVAGHSCRQKSGKRYSNDLDIDVVMEEFCSHIHQKNISCEKHELSNELHMQSIEKNSGFEEKLCKAIELFISQKYSNAENRTEDGKLHSEQLMDALRVLGSDKELFLKLEQDPNSLLKYIKISEDAGIKGEEKFKSFAGSVSEQELSTNKQTEEVLNRKQRNFFRRKVKSQENISFQGNENPQASNRIVILKPGPTCSQTSETETSFGSSPQSRLNIRNKGPSEKVASHFSLTEIKRKLKHAMGKELHGISGNAVLEKVPTECPKLRGRDKGVVEENFGWKSPGKDHFYMERHVKPSAAIQRGDKPSKRIDCEMSMEHKTTGYSEQRASNIYIEAKKHLFEMLSNRDENEGCSNGPVLKTLGRTLSLPEYNFSPIDSPGREWEQSFVTAQMRLSAADKLSRTDKNMPQLRLNNLSHLDPLTQNIEIRSHSSDDRPNDKLEALNSDPRISDEVLNSSPNISNGLFHDKIKEETFISARDKLNSEDAVEKVTDTSLREDINVSDAPLGTSCSSISKHDQDGQTPEISDNKGYCEYLKPDSCEENQPQCSPISSPSSSSIAHKFEGLESTIEPERPSPVSVLEPIFTLDEISPARTIRNPGELQTPLLRILFEEQDSSPRNHDTHEKYNTEDKEPIFGYVKAVLQASGLSWDELYIRSLSSEQLLDPSLFDQVQFVSNQHFHEKKLLFDCINEVLTEVCAHYFGCSKSSIKPLPNMKNALHEIWEGIQWHLLPHPPPHTLDQIVRKDMERDRTWMYLQFDIASIHTEMGDSILEELIEDTLSILVNDSTGSGYPVLPDEQKEM